MQNKPLKTKKDLPRILLAIVIAFALWAFTISEADPLTTNKYSNIPVEFSGIETLAEIGLMIKPIEKEVDIELYGRTLQISKQKKADIKAIMDLSKITQEGNYTIETVIFGVNDNINVVEISEKYIMIDIVPINEKEFDYSISTEGELADNYGIIGTNNTAGKVDIQSSDAILSTIDNVTGTIDTSNKDSSFTEEVKLTAYDKQGRVVENITINPSKIKVDIEIGMIKTVDVNVITTGQLPLGVELASTKAIPDKVLISASKKVLDGINSINTFAVDLENRNENFTTTVGLNLAEGVILLSKEDTLEVEVKLNKINEKIVDIESVQLRNKPNDLICTIENFEKVSLTITSDDPLDNISASDIVVYVDLNELEAGTHTVELKYELPQGVKLKSSSIKNINIELK